jgi:hypothetical protein
MQLLELAVQNARGLSPSVRVALRPGYGVLRPPAEGASLGALLAAILYADGRGSDAAFLAPGQGQGAVRVVFTGNDGQTYRLTRTLGGAGLLERLDLASRSAQRISQDSAEISQYLRSQAGLPTKKTFELLCTFPLAGLPSRFAKPLQPTAPEKPAPALLAGAQVAPAEDVSAARARLEALLKERGMSERIEKVQFRADGLASEIFELETTLKGTTGLEAALAEAKKAFDAAPTCASAGVPEDLLARAQRLPSSLAKRDEALAKIAAEREAELAAVEAANVPPLTQDSRFWAGIGLGAVTLVGGALASGLLRYVALLDIPAFGFSAVLALQYVDELKDATRLRTRGDRLAERERKVTEQYEQEAAPVREAMKKLEVETPEALANLLGQREVYGQKVAELSAQLEQAKAAPEYLAASTKLDQLKVEHAQLNEELGRLGGTFVRELGEVDREVERVKQSIALAESARPASSAPQTAASGGAGEVEDPFPPLMAEAADLLRVDVPALAAQVQDRAAQYLVALTERRLSGVRFDLNGKAQFLAQAGPKPAGALPLPGLDVAYLAVRLALAERVVAKAGLPLLVDDAVSALDGRLHPLLGRMLKQLGTGTQVLQTTARGGFAQLADWDAAV